MPTPLVVAMLAAYGAVLASFCNVIIDRLPYQLDEPDRFGDTWGSRPWREVLGGTSRCSTCGAPVRPINNIPIVSWLLLRGRCRDCSAAIPAFHFVVELIVPLLWVGLWLAGARHWQLLPAYWLVPFGVTVSAIDLRILIVPTKLVWPGLAVTLVLSVVAVVAASEPSWLLHGAVGLATLAGPLFLIWLITGSGMGWGDIRLATVVGWTVGFGVGSESLWGTAFAIVVTLGLSSVIGLIVGIGALGARGMKAKVPFGPMMIAGALVCLALADGIRAWVDG